MPPSPPSDGRPAPSTAMAIVTEGPDLGFVAQVSNANRRRRRLRRRRLMAVAVVVAAVADRVGRARKSTCAANAGGMPPSPPFDGRPASSAVVATVTEGPDLSHGPITQTGGGGVYGGGGPRPSLSSSLPSPAAPAAPRSRRARPTPAVCHRRRRTTADRRHPPSWRPRSYDRILCASCRALHTAPRDQAAATEERRPSATPPRVRWYD